MEKRKSLCDMLYQARCDSDNGARKLKTCWTYVLDASRHSNAAMIALNAGESARTMSLLSLSAQRQLTWTNYEIFLFT